MHPLVYDLYKRVIIVGRDYPHPGGLSYVREAWKKALKSYKPPEIDSKSTIHSEESLQQLREKELLKAIAKGRFMVREMIGVIQIKKYREMKARYDTSDKDISLEQAINSLEKKAKIL